MNKLVERYIYDVTRRLPENERAEVGRELAASIADMLPDEPGEQDITAALTELGPPRTLAEQYRQKQRYLISPAMFELYLTVLRTVVLVVAVICAIVGVLINVFSYETVYMAIGSTVAITIQGALQTAFWVTVGFVIADFAELKQKKPWTVKDLPPLPNQNGVKISRSSSTAGVVLSALFAIVIVALIVQGEWFFMWLQTGEGAINPFSQEALLRCIPFVVLLGILGGAINLLKLHWGRWNVRLCIANALYNVAWVGIAIYIVQLPDLLSAEFVTLVGTLLKDEPDVLLFIQSGGVATVFIVAFVAIAAIDIGVAVWNTWRGRREDVVPVAADK
ncbi:MAG: hypothetical protein FWH32_08590 [Clostridiales bacterium]|nr:hypothetical protein [Clostridiales bacterium]